MKPMHKGIRLQQL